MNQKIATPLLNYDRQVIDNKSLSLSEFSSGAWQTHEEDSGRQKRVKTSNSWFGLFQL